MNKYMEEAIKEAYIGINSLHGGPFGSVIVKDDVIVGRGHNLVVKKNDPTLHGEIVAIKDACHNLNTFDLSNCELYTTAEPCPMCLGAILWANINKVYYGCNTNDSEDIGFKDSKFYEILKGNSNELQMSVVDRESCLELFDKYDKSKDKTRY